MQHVQTATTYELISLVGLLLALPFIGRRVKAEVLAPRLWFAAVAVPSLLLRPLYLALCPRQAHAYLVQYGLVGELMVPALVCVVVGLVGFNAGYLSEAGEWLGARLPALNMSLSTSRWKGAIAACVATGGGAYLLLVGKVGGVGNLVANLAVRSEFYAEAGVGLIRLALSFNNVGILLASWYYLKVRRSKWFWIYMVAVTGMNITCGSRAGVLIPWLMFYLLAAIDNVRWRNWKVAAAVGLGVVMFFTSYLAFRRSAGLLQEREGIVATVMKQSEALNPIESFRTFDHLMAAIHLVPGHFAYQEGTTYVHFVALLVPRSVLGWHPRTTGRMLREAIEPLGRGGRPLGAIGEGYLNFGHVGAFAAMLALGLWLRVVHSYGVRHLESGSVVAPLFYVPVVASIPGFVGGVFSLNFRDLLITLTLLTVAVCFASTPRKRKEGHHNDCDDFAAA